jgi:multidrug efflux pump subunit AcrA (membrane-fusion protein)
VVTLYQPESLQVRVDVRFEDIPKISLGQPVQINNVALPEPIPAEVLFVSSEANIQKNTLQVKVQVGSAPPVLKPEMLVDVTFLAPKSAGDTSQVAEKVRFYLPASLIHKDEGGSFVWLVDQSQNVVRKTAVTTGKTASGGLVEVTEGLSTGNRVVARSYEDLRDGASIQVVSEEPESVSSMPMDSATLSPHGMANKEH